MRSRSTPSAPLHTLPAEQLQALCAEQGPHAVSERALDELRKAGPSEFDAAFGVAAQVAELSEATEAIALAERYAQGGGANPDALPGWDAWLRAWFTQLARRFPVELAAAAPRFRAGASEVLGYCLAQAEHAPLPHSVRVRVARHFLNAAPGRFAFEGQLSLSVLAESCELLLTTERFPVLQRSRIEQLEPVASRALRVGLAVSYCGQDFRRVGVELLSGLGGLERGAGTETELHDVLHELAALLDRQPPLSLEGQIVLALYLARQPLIHELSSRTRIQTCLLLDLRSGSLDDADVTEVSLRALGAEVTRSLLAETLREARTTVLIPTLASDELVSELLESLDAGKLDATLAEQALLRSGTHVTPLLVAFGVAKKRSATAASVVAHALGELRASEAASLLVGWLGHSSKSASNAARQALEKLGDAAKEALAAGCASSKREVRDASTQLLARLALQRPTVTTPLDRVAQRALELGEAKRRAFLERCTRLSGAYQSWAAKLRPLLLELGAVSLHWLQDWFWERVQRHEVRLWCYAVELLKSDELAVWVAVDTFARMKKVPTSAWAAPRNALATAGALLGPAVAHALTNVGTEYKEPLYRLLARHASGAAQALLVAGLSDERKLVRTHCVDGLSRLADVDPAPIVALLTGGSLGSRLAAAELLAVWGKSGSAEPLLGALQLERSARVRPYLEEALVACGCAQALLGADGDATEFERAVEAFLERRPSAKVPRFLAHEPLPRVCLRSGRELSEAASTGLLALAMQLDFTWKGRLLRSMKAVLDAPSLSEWSAAVHSRWFRAKDSRHKWAVLQLWVFGTTEAIEQVAAGLGKLRPTEHLALTCYLKVLEWHGTQPVLSWLFHWSHCLRSRGLRATAREFLERVAFRQGRPIAELVASLDSWVAERAREKHCNELTEPAAAANAVRQLCSDSWASGRGFTVRQVLAWNERSGGALEGSVWRCRALESATWFRPCRGAPRDVTGAELTLDETSEIVPAHPLEATLETVASWQRELAQHVLPPSFLQFERPVFIYGGELDLVFDDWRTDSERLERWLRREGWVHGQPLELGVVFSNTRAYPARGVVARLQHSGYVIGAREDVEPIQLLQLSFEDLDGGFLPAEEIDPILYSEVCACVTRIVTPLDEHS